MSDKMEVLKGWIEIKLGVACEVITGNTPPKNDPENYGSEIPFIKPPNLQHTIIGNTEEMLSEKGGLKSRLVPENSVLVTCIGNLGRTGFCKRISAFNQQINAILENEYLYGKFIFYLAQSPLFKLQLESLAAATTVTIVNKGKFETINIPIPPLAEQHRIVDKIEELFSSLDKGIESLKTAQAQLKTYRQAVLKWAFEGKLTEAWRNENLIKIKCESLEEEIKNARDEYYSNQINEWENSLAEWKNNGCLSKKPSKPSKLIIPDPPSPDHEKKLWDIPEEWIWTQIGTVCFVTKLAGFEYTDYVKYDENGDLFVLKAENVGSNGFKETEYSKIDSKSVNMLKRSFIFGGELIIVFVGAGTGNVAMVPSNKNFFLGPNIGLARPYIKLNSRYLEYQLQSALGKRMLTAAMKAVAQPSLSMGTIRQTPIAFTCLEEQSRIVAEIEKRLSVCDMLEESIAQSLTQAEALRQSILKKAFEGKLVPQDPSEEPASVLLERIRAERAASVKESLTVGKKRKKV